MIKIENEEVVGWRHAIRGMRNPFNSWGKSDTTYVKSGPEYNGGLFIENETIRKANFTFRLGANDRKLMLSLANGGSDDRKFMRMITVYLDITAPLYWWKEFDTYKVGTVANSCSTMHTIAEKEFTIEDFSCERLLPNPSLETFNTIIESLNVVRDIYLECKDPVIKKDFWWQMIQLLPSSYNQRRTVMLNYEVLKNMYHARKNHKLDEWRKFCAWIETLPFSTLITGIHEEECEYID